jgi:hypothetical protein
MAINQDIKNRTEWFKELWTYVLDVLKDPDVAKTAYKRLLFEEE